MIQIPGRPRAGDEGRVGGRAESAPAPVRRTNVLAAEFRAVRPKSRRSDGPALAGGALRRLTQTQPLRRPASSGDGSDDRRRHSPISRERCGRRRSQGLGTRRHRPRKGRCARRGWGKIVAGKRTEIALAGNGTTAAKALGCAPLGGVTGGCRQDPKRGFSCTSTSLRTLANATRRHDAEGQPLSRGRRDTRRTSRFGWCAPAAPFHAQR